MGVHKILDIIFSKKFTLLQWHSTALKKPGLCIPIYENAQGKDHIGAFGLCKSKTIHCWPRFHLLTTQSQLHTNVWLLTRGAWMAERLTPLASNR